MKSILSLLTCLTMALLAENTVGYSDTPVNPHTGYRVHDSELPQPVKVVAHNLVSTPAPSDATILFNGENTDAWNGNWKVEDGILIASPGNLVTNEGFGSCQLHIEFRIPADRAVQGQNGGNSGVFLMGQYEVQVQESHTNITYPDGQAGALYGQYPPLVNPSLPQGEWQSYDIIFEAPIYEGEKCVTPAKMTVLHNGILVHHSTDLLGTTKHKQVASYPAKHPSKAPLLLQWHQDPVQFRNIWIRELGDYPRK